MEINKLTNFISANMKDPKNIMVVVDVPTGQTLVLGTGDPWMDMAIQLEGLAMTCQKCIQSGMSRKEVFDEIKNYFMKIEASGGYTITKSEKI